MAISWLPAYLNNLTTANYGMWNSPTPGLHADGSVTPGEGGVDIGTPNGTPVYAIANGPIIASGYWKDNAHGVITQRVTVPGAGQQDLYYQHIQLAPNMTPGQNLTKGQLIGYIGPYNEIEMGFNAAWGGVWGTNHPGPWIKDPRPWINAILSGNGANAGGFTSQNTPQCGQFDFVCQMQNYFVTNVQGTLVQWGEYIAIFILSIILIITGFIVLNQPAAEKVGKAVARSMV